MAERLTRQLIADKAIVHDTIPAVADFTVDRTFEVPSRLYVAMAGLFAAFLAVMAIGFPHKEMILPMAIFAIFLAGFFGVPALWVRMKPDNTVRPLTWSRFRANGIQTAHGRVTARDATIQMLILPTLILGWGIVVVTIAALV